MGATGGHSPCGGQEAEKGNTGKSQDELSPKDTALVTYFL